MNEPALVRRVVCLLGHVLRRPHPVPTPVLNEALHHALGDLDGFWQQQPAPTTPEAWRARDSVRRIPGLNLDLDWCRLVEERDALREVMGAPANIPTTGAQPTA